MPREKRKLRKKNIKTEIKNNKQDSKKSFTFYVIYCAYVLCICGAWLYKLLSSVRLLAVEQKKKKIGTYILLDLNGIDILTQIVDKKKKKLKTIYILA